MFNTDIYGVNIDMDFAKRKNVISVHVEDIKTGEGKSFSSKLPKPAKFEDVARFLGRVAAECEQVASERMPRDTINILYDDWLEQGAEDYLLMAGDKRKSLNEEELNQIAQDNNDLYEDIKSRDPVLVDEVKVGDCFLVAYNVVRITRITDSEIHVVRINPDGSNGEKIRFERFNGQRLHLVSKDDLREAIYLAKAVGGFKPRDIFGDRFQQAVVHAIDHQRHRSY